jgi:hypothetical protein
MQAYSFAYAFLASGLRYAILISLAGHDVAEVSSPRRSRVQRRTPVDDEQLS